ncbi:SO_0444 family Cu/Zn efflux transporter [Desulfurivibrio alkaliphilus]|uniref:Permease n=1 Tax=Desulfurivibrio alkaliphilus (strain DSM 19089 / UNIQEM U267 / AHT2) TaxID=589865 RepID=D6Z1Z6_DESAT|nr:SO_0444 family Cu/Zn efflux transporter [Desulfurivibrio alkaliphilus]ADH85571.1 permease [Desulfurivibrio alkaliphilus AHT 2]
MLLFFSNTLGLALDAAPWLLLGLALAGLIKAWIPERLLTRWLGGTGISAVLRASLVGAPLPLCSCGAIPLALALHRGGASRGPCTAFMVGTPGVGVDSVALTYVLLGPLLAIIRPLAAIFSALTTGMLVGLTGKTAAKQAATGVALKSASSSAVDSCSNSCACRLPTSPAASTAATETAASRIAALTAGLRYAFTEVLDDISWWLLLGLLLAGLLLTLVPPGFLAQYATGLPAMLLMAVVGIPMYLCAQAATPVAAALIISGVSPGTALVFLLAGPITSIATLTVFRNEFGTAAMVLYLAGVAGSAVLGGVLTDALITFWAVDLAAQVGAARELLPLWLRYASLLLLLGLAARPIRRRFF